MSEYGVIWDVDGTLVDTAELHFEAWAALAKELDKPFTRTDFQNTFGRRNPEIIHELFDQHYSDQEIADLGFRKEEYYRAAAKAGVQLLPGVRTLLDSLHAAGFKQAIGSSAPRQNLDLILTLNSLDHFFEVVVSMEDTRRGKPDPEVFLTAAKRMGIPPERCVVFEDAVAGVQAAHAGGMKAIGVTFVGHHSDESLRQGGADLVVKGLEDVSVETVRDLLGANDFHV